MISRLRPAPDGPVGAVEVQDGVDDDGNPVAKVRIGLREPTVYEVRSWRQTIQVRFARPVKSTPTPAPGDAAAAPPPVGRSRPATALLSVETVVEPHAISVTLHGNGALVPGKVHEAEHLPPRLVIDFPHLAAEAASVTPVEIDPVKQVRVAPNSPELTRAVFDLVRPAVFHIERVDGNDRALRVVFPRDHAIDPVAQIGGDPASQPVAAVEPFNVTTLAPLTRRTEPVAVRVDGSPMLHPDLAGAPRPVGEGQEIAGLRGSVAPRAWPEIRHLPSAVVALAPDAAPLRSPWLGDLPPLFDWPEIPRLATAALALDPSSAPLMQPEPLDLPPPVDTVALSVTPLAVVSEASPSETEPRTAAVAVAVEPATFEVAAAVEPAAAGVPAPAVEPAAATVPAPAVEPAVGVTPALSEPVGSPEPGELLVAASRESERFVSLGGSGRPTAAASRTAMQLPGQATVTLQEYTGDPLSMDFQGADLRAVLRIFASEEVSGLNLVIDPSVQGEVNVSLTEVPWDQAFDIILRANGLAYEVDGTVVRIASLQRLQEEAQARALLSQREAEAGELVLFTRTLSYARAADLVQLITSTTLSPRGEVFTDPRTNTLIIRDLEERLVAVGDLLDTLDQAEPQVEIEARIVQASHTSARALGVQWGVTGRVAQEIGNTLPFSFPNRGGLTGRVGAPDGQGPSGLDSRALPDENAATAVDLGVDAATSALGLTLSAVNGALNLDVVLSALESQGELRIISSPRVMTQNNVAAEILQGDQIPYQTVANNTVTVQFKEAALTLRVTPQITASNTVIMQVELENSFPDFGNALGDPPIPPIVTQRAQTTVQVEDGETTVIGGIFENTQAERSNRTPGLSRIPLLGWLFQSNDRSESTDELMIFLTPRIVQ